MRIVLRDINKKGVEMGERQYRCHDDIRLSLEVKMYKKTEQLYLPIYIHSHSRNDYKHIAKTSNYSLHCQRQLKQI